jgi:heptosyltransferase-1
VSQVFGYALGSDARYGVTAPSEPLSWLNAPRYAVLLHAASRAEKRWPEERWIALARILSEHGYAPVFPGGTDEELGRATRLAHAVPNGIAAPRMGLREAAALLGHAAGVVGVDTGLTHLAVALGVPTVGIYCATRPELTGLHGENAVNVGGAGAPPSVEAVAEAVARGTPGG